MTRPRLMGDAIGRRRHRGHGSPRQPSRGSRSPPLPVVSQLSPRISLPPSGRLGGPSARQRSLHVGRVVVGPIPPDRKQDPRQALPQGHRGDGPAAPSGNPICPVAQRGPLVAGGASVCLHSSPQREGEESAEGDFEHQASEPKWPSRTANCQPPGTSIRTASSRPGATRLPAEGLDLVVLSPAE